MIVIDSTILLLFLSPLTLPPTDVDTGKPIEHASERVSLLVKTLEQKRTKIIIPTPVLAEVLVRAGDAAESYMEVLSKRQVFRPVSFDTRAAIEHSVMTRQAIRTGDKKEGVPESWAKVKFDRQIVAIAKAYGVNEIYSDDKGVTTLGTVNNINVIGLSSCPIPVYSLQAPLPFGSDESDAERSRPLV